MRSLRWSVEYGESIGEHAAEALEQFLLLAGRQFLPPGFARRGWVQARGGAGLGRLDMVRLLRYGRGSPDTSGRVQARPRGKRSPEVLYSARQRLRRLEVFVWSFFKLAKKLSIGALSQQFPRRLMLHPIRSSLNRRW